jgi:hypothetical protein
MSGAVGDETRRRVANVVHDNGDDNYDEELDPPAANGGVVVVVVGGGDLGDIDRRRPRTEETCAAAFIRGGMDGQTPGPSLKPRRVLSSTFTFRTRFRNDWVRGR